MFRVGFVANGMEMVTCSGSVLFSLFCMLGIFLSLSLSCPWIAVNGPSVFGVFCCMAGCLVLGVLVRGSLGCFFWATGHEEH